MPTFRKPGGIIGGLDGALLDAGPLRPNLGEGRPNAVFRAVDVKVDLGFAAAEFESEMLIMGQGIGQARPEVDFGGENGWCVTAGEQKDGGAGSHLVVDFGLIFQDAGFAQGTGRKPGSQSD